MKYFLIFTGFLAFTGCMTNYPLTTFYVKNNSGKTVHFKAGVIKHSSAGPFEMTVPFTVLPGDSVLARQVHLKKDAPPSVWFTSFIIFPVDSVVLNEPKKDENWIRYTDAKGKTVYTFNIAQ